MAMLRIADVQHDLLHSDFAQGATVKALPNERAVQNWVADRLRLKQGRSYSIEREPHVVDEKEPDLRLRAKVSDASLAIEIKVAESWTIEQLEAALVVQLCGRYLRARDGRYGILLLVHQRPHQWRDPVSQEFMTFAEVAERLRMLAANISGGSSDAPQPEVSVIDVSDVEEKARRRSPSKRASQKGHGSQKISPGAPRRLDNLRKHQSSRAVTFQSRLQWLPLKYNGLPCHSPLQLSSQSAAEACISSKSSAVRCRLEGEYGRSVGHPRRRLARS